MCPIRPQRGSLCIMSLGHDWSRPAQQPPQRVLITATSKLQEHRCLGHTLFKRPAWALGDIRDLTFEAVEATRESSRTDFCPEHSCRGDDTLQLQRLSCRGFSRPEKWNISTHACSCNPQPGQLLELLH